MWLLGVFCVFGLLGVEGAPSCSGLGSVQYSTSAVEAHTKCWAVDCVGVFGVTFTKVTLQSATQMLLLHNEAGYELDTLTGDVSSLQRTFPANGKITLVFTDTQGSPASLAFEGTCQQGTPADAFPAVSAANYLTLPPSGTYARVVYTQGSHGWVIPCVGTVVLRASHGTDAATYVLRTGGRTVLSQLLFSELSFEHDVDGGLEVDVAFYEGLYNVSLWWACRGLGTVSPPTSAPAVAPPSSVCAPLPTTLLFYSHDRYVGHGADPQCWTLMCAGTLTLQIVNLHLGTEGIALAQRLSLLNSRGFQLEALTGSHMRYKGVYPTDGNTTLDYAHGAGFSTRDYSRPTFNVSWECDSSADVPEAAPMRDTADYLTLAPTGTYFRMANWEDAHHWVIPCQGALDVAVDIGSAVGNGTCLLVHSNGSIVHTTSEQGTFTARYDVSGDFEVHLLVKTSPDFPFAMSWACNAALPALPLRDETEAPSTSTPIAVPCEDIDHGNVHVVANATGEKCWTMQCLGSIDLKLDAVQFHSTYFQSLSLQNSDGYQLDRITMGTSLVRKYLANGEVTLLHTDTKGDVFPISFHLSWTCTEDASMIPLPAASFPKRTQLTLPARHSTFDTVSRSVREAGEHRWVVPCVGILAHYFLVDTDDTRVNMTYYTGMGGVQGVYVVPLKEYKSGWGSVWSYFQVRLQIAETLPIDVNVWISWDCGDVTTSAAYFHKTYPTAPPETLPPATSCPVSTSVSYAGVMDTTTSATTSKCWAIKCTGVLRMTYRNIDMGGVHPQLLSLRNTQGYELDSLGDHRDVHEADYPADGTLTLVYSEVLNGLPPAQASFEADWTCEPGPVVEGVTGKAEKTHLTLRDTGVYRRFMNWGGSHRWVIPCFKLLGIAVDFDTWGGRAELRLLNSNGSVVYSTTERSRLAATYFVLGDFEVQIDVAESLFGDYPFAMSWSCGGAAAALPSTAAPQTAAPLLQCTSLVGTTLQYTAGTSDAPFTACWTMQCSGTFNATFTNLTLASSHVQLLSLQNSRGYQLEELTGHYGHYATGALPTDGDVVLVYNDTYGGFDASFAMAWSCESGYPIAPTPALPPAQHLTLAAAGRYSRVFHWEGEHAWVIPCQGLLTVGLWLADSAGKVVARLVHSNGSVVHTMQGGGTEGHYDVAGDFQVVVTVEGVVAGGAQLSLVWSCGSRSEAPLVATVHPMTRSPVTPSPLRCTEAGKSPLQLEETNKYRSVTCWTLTCSGVLWVNMSNVTISSTLYALLSLHNSEGYQLDSFTGKMAEYTATYPSDGEMMLVMNVSSPRGRQDYSFKLDWVCKTGPVLETASDRDAAEYLTLPSTGTYHRMVNWEAVHSWVIPCEGLLEIGVDLGRDDSISQYSFVNSNGSVVHTTAAGGSFASRYAVADYFEVRLRVEAPAFRRGTFAMAWSCGGVRPEVPSIAQPPVGMVSFGSSAAPCIAASGSGSLIVYDECYTVDCHGMLWISLYYAGADKYPDPFSKIASIVNGNGYEVGAFTLVDEYGVFPSDGTLSVEIKSTMPRNDALGFRTACYEGPTKASAPGYDAAEYLTLPSTGNYSRLVQWQGVHKWLLPCIGTLNIIVKSDVNDSLARVLFTNKGGVVYSATSTEPHTADYDSDGYFVVEVQVFYTLQYGAAFTFNWTCNGTAPEIPTEAPPTVSPTEAPPGFTTAPIRVHGASAAPSGVGGSLAPGSDMLQTETPDSASIPGSADGADLTRVPGATRAPGPKGTYVPVGHTTESPDHNMDAVTEEESESDGWLPQWWMWQSAVLTVCLLMVACVIYCYCYGRVMCCCCCYGKKGGQKPAPEEEEEMALDGMDINDNGMYPYDELEDVELDVCGSDGISDGGSGKGSTSGGSGGARAASEDSREREHTCCCSLDMIEELYSVGRVLAQYLPTDTG